MRVTPPPQATEHHYSDPHTSWVKTMSNAEEFRRAPSGANHLDGDPSIANSLTTVHRMSRWAPRWSARLRTNAGPLTTQERA